MSRGARPGNKRWGVLRPLENRDFAWLWLGMTVSLVGDGIYFVALAWQVYQLSNAPAALSVVGIAWMLPQVVFALIGGVLSDRFDRRRILIFSDGLRAAAVAAIGLLSLAGVLELWHVIALVAFYGLGEALFGPAFGAIVPDVVPSDQLLEANSLDQFVRPIAMRFAGPALGGLLIAQLGGTGQAFLVDAGTFVVSALAITIMRAGRATREPASGERSMLAEIKQGFDYVRSEAWLGLSFVASAVGLLCFFGPWQVLVPYVVKNSLHGTAGDLGFVIAAGGVSAVVVSFVIGQRQLPRRPVRFVYSSWAAGTVAVAGFGMVTALWQAMLVSLLMSGLFTAGIIVWSTLMHRLVPTHLLGRVSSFDWMVSLSLIPVSYALTGPAAEVFGAAATLIGAGLAGGIAILLFLRAPGVGRIDDLGVERAAAAAKGLDTAAN
jgi:MFS family permease